jgi:hypothetical protein
MLNFFIIFTVLSLGLYSLWFYYCVLHNSTRNIFSCELLKYRNIFNIAQLNESEKVSRTYSEVDSTELDKQPQFYLYIERRFLFIPISFRYHASYFTDVNGSKSKLPKIFNSKKEVIEIAKEMKESHLNQISLTHIIKQSIISKINNVRKIESLNIE